MRPNLPELVARWQKLLKLRDWRISVEYVPNLAAPDGRPVYGLCSPFLDSKQAAIQIRDPQTPVAGAAVMEVEDTLVHELLHLHFAPLADNTSTGITAEEQAVWAITEAFSSVKGSGDGARLARAFVTQRNLRLQRERKSGMDPIVLAALKAALSAEDPKAAVEALIAQLEGGATDTTDPAAAEAPPDGGDGEPMRAEPPKDDTNPKAQKISPAAPRAAAPVLQLPRKTVVPASAVVSRKEFDRFRVATVLDKRPELTDAQRAFAIDLPFETVEKWLKTLTPPAADGAGAGDQGAGTRAARPTTPTPGAARATSSDDVISLIDRRMGIAPPPEQTVSRDVRTGRLTISSLQPVRLKKAGE